MVYKAVRDKDGNLTATRKNIANLSLRINSFEEIASMEILIIGIEERGYTVHSHLKYLFFCHTNLVKNARHFPEMVLINATYKTNVYKLLFVNFVDISNLEVSKLQTFDIARAWISDESEKSYIWIVKQLASLVFFDVIPFIFVIDNEAALIGALRRIFPKVENLLCTWHVLNNFKKHLKKYFNDDLLYEIIKTMDSFINSRDYETLNSAITDYKKLAALSLNADKVIKYLD
ncbi:8131_t:CDS:2, partial [Racocetra persica]